MIRGLSGGGGRCTVRFGSKEPGLVVHAVADEVADQGLRV